MARYYPPLFRYRILHRRRWYERGVVAFVLRALERICYPHGHFHLGRTFVLGWVVFHAVVYALCIWQAWRTGF